MKLLVLVFCAFLGNSLGQFEVPDALVEVFKPQGLRVSIPDVEGIKLFAFHAKVNEEMNGREGGTFSRDILKAKNGRWTFYDPLAKLEVGDVLYYWTYVDYFDGRNKLAYTKDDQTFVVTERKDKEPSKQPVPDIDIRNQCKPTATVSNGAQSCAGKEIFSDNFDSFESKFWEPQRKFAGGPDYEFVIYSNKQENLQVSDGHLKIKPLPSEEVFGAGFVADRQEYNIGNECTGTPGTTDCTQTPFAYLVRPPVASAQITTKNKFSFKYGKVEIRAKLPKGDWIYPQLFLNPVKEEYGSQYASGQIRIAFLGGNAHLNTNLKGGCVLGDSVAGRSYGLKTISKNQGSWSDDFHKFSVVWKPNEISVSVDDTVYGSIYPPEGGFAGLSHRLELGNVDSWRRGTSLAPFDKEMYLVLGVGVGGLCFEDGAGGNKPWSKLDPKGQKNFWKALSEVKRTWGDQSVLSVEYVKVWAL